jgi:hypothetical protein
VGKIACRDGAVCGGVRAILPTPSELSIRPGGQIAHRLCYAAKTTAGDFCSPYQRRADEWTLQCNLAAHELMQVGRQILTSLIAEQIAHHEYQSMQQQIANAQDFVKFNYWDGGRKGLLSGEALYLDVKRMEMAYHDNNKRELELLRALEDLHSKKGLDDLRAPGRHGLARPRRARRTRARTTWASMRGPSRSTSTLDPGWSAQLIATSTTR